MHKLLNFFCFPLFIIGAVLVSSGIVGYDLNFNIESNTKTSAQINKLYSEKEITLKDPPVSEKLSEKLIVKIRKKPINPKIFSDIENLNNIITASYLSESDFDHLNSEKKKFVKTVLPIIINQNQNVLITRDFLLNLKTKLDTFRTLSNSEVNKLNKSIN